MLKAMQIENFKGIGRPARLELRPITLLFGPNSAGKSSLLHAMHYAREILENGNCDPDTTEVGGPFVDLGGFKELVHLHEHQDRDVVLQFWVAPEDRPIPERGGEPVRWVELRDYNTNLHREINDFCVTIKVGWNNRLSYPIVKEYGIEVNGEPIGQLCVGEDGQRVDLRNLNFSHPLITYNREREQGKADAEQVDDFVEEFYRNLEEYERIECPQLRSSALPTWGEALWLDFAGIDDVEAYQGGTLIYRLTALFVGLGELLRQELRSLRYLGPIRETPARTHSAPLTKNPARWATGLAAWDQLEEGSDAQLREVNHWLDSLGTGASVEVEEFKELRLSSPLMAAISSGTATDDFDSLATEISNLKTKRRLVVVDEERQLSVAPGDVGIGISQIVPVVVAVVGADSGTEPWIVAIEQPELHVHPRVQVELGDLFAWRASERRGICIIETHSEHLMLRLLRRIQETHRGDLAPDQPRLNADQLSVVFVEQEEGEVRATQLRIANSGEFADRWPHGFFEERVRELF